MLYRNHPSKTSDSYTLRISLNRRAITMLVALCCLSIGIGIGAIARGVVGARPDDNRVSISSARVTVDSLSASFARAAEQVEPSVAHIKVYDTEFYTREGAGSGVIVNSTGFILTNAHVVSRAIKLKVKLADGTEIDARVVGIDSPTDLAVIKIDFPRPLPVARMGDSDKLNVGDWVLAIGSPFGLEQTVTAGIISAKDRVAGTGSTPFQQFLQTDAAINPGNSGGPLVNLAGEVIGINTQIATSTGVYSGIGFALPSSTAVDIYNQLVTDGKVRRGFLGAFLEEMTNKVARSNGILDGAGVVVRELASEASPAARAGLLSGDVIIEVNGQKVKTVRELIRRVASLGVGSTANVTYIRDGARRTASVKLEERKDEPETPRSIRPTPLPMEPETQEKQDGKSRSSKSRSSLGITAKTLTSDLARVHGLEGARGAYVISVEPSSIAADNGLIADDLIVEVNTKPVASLEDLQRLTRDVKSGDQVFIKVLRSGRGPLRRSYLISFAMP
ncbi:MAG TPA: trypsin-like peptidase domain-containing protein [Blastocatellia bacterium]|nr:trypsin-like peptidase domain-containing protein [Blastocatellia bacterium]